jgi:hypothetical protein
MIAKIADSSSEMAIFRRIVDTDQPALSIAAARAILRLNFGQSDRDRMNELAAKNRQGELTPDEDEELGNYIRVGQTLGILQSKARRSLPEKERTSAKKRRRK